MVLSLLVVIPRDGLVNQRRVLSEEFILVVMRDPGASVWLSTPGSDVNRGRIFMVQWLCLTPAQSNRLNWICIFLIRSPYQQSV